MSDFDYIIVGAGSSGCVLANRLSADPRISVLLIESGGKDRSPLIRIPKGFGKILGDDKLTWHFPVRPIGPSNNVEEWVRGRTLGGSSAVNGMVYNRGSRADYDAMESLGNPGWGWDTILPIFRKIENHSLGADATRGAGGPLDVSVGPLVEVSREFVDAARGLGWAVTDDLNATDDQRIGPAVRTIKNGRRVSAAHAFLRPVQNRPNLTIAVNTTVERIVFEGDKAVGVQARTGKGRATYTARRETILSLGSIATPKLLQLSGIGDGSELRRLGIEVRVDSPNVGRRMREHRCVSLQYRLNRNVGYNKKLATAAQQALTGIQYLATRKGPLAGGAYDVVGFFKTSPELDRPDAQLLMAPFSAAPFEPGKELGLEREPGMQAIGYVLRPDSEGHVTITSADPDAPLDIDPNFLTSDHDRRVVSALFRTMRHLFEQSPIADLIVAETRPGSAVQSEQEIVDAALDHGYCGYHAVGTCAMGPSDDDVVDPSLRVRGVDGLRVMDCSVMPTMVSGNLNGPAMAMAWHAADLILSGA
ncbi:GMC family oxidoreductase N-terminal domain-containing protein [Mycolicibacterium flavescens]|uniref:GMC oxidoreductase n=1 Tax=Mycolicibacterium flavescens TaxID=1776 RepID=A0A1E3REP5_MYCFV|nr:GMC family oxidoreductase N-terminal domain-containing protein [Mycolicibacterium flavescens]MCV7282400.1 GMC family oxidoreductase N-terminal domain-containing protein [Mycolicibacterium flavescens]ODQ87922.1 GMC oxidoreductase [Mycolicibacterium flavescens]